MEYESKFDQPPQGETVELELGDGSKLVCDVRGSAACRIEADEVSFDDVMQHEGQPFAGYRLLEVRDPEAAAARAR
jgi:hypothetical protein